MDKLDKLIALAMIAITITALTLAVFIIWLMFHPEVFNG